MQINVTIHGGETDHELAAIAALIEVLRNGERHDPVMPELTVGTLPNSPSIGQTLGQIGPASSSDGSERSLPFTFVTDRPAYVETAEVVMHDQSGMEIGRHQVPVVPPIPPAPPAPAALPAVPQPPDGNTAPTTSDVDAEGLPWDERIHSSSRNRTAKDVWARRRNTPDKLWDSVRLELRRAMDAPAPDAASAFAPPAPPLYNAGIDPGFTAGTPAAVMEGGIPVPPLPPSVPVPPAPVPMASAPPAATNAADPFSALLTRILDAGIPPATTQAACDAIWAETGADLPAGIRFAQDKPNLIAMIDRALFAGG